MPSLTDMKKKSLIVGRSICTIVGLFLLMTVIVVPSVSASNNNCVDIDCLKEKLRRICQSDPNRSIQIVKIFPDV